jgi:hypothetical protein
MPEQLPQESFDKLKGNTNEKEKNNILIHLISLIQKQLKKKKK